MTPEETELLTKASLDELSSDEERRLQDLLAREPEVKAEFERLKGMANLVAGAQPASFEPYFANRVMQRIQGGREGGATALADSLTRMFYRLAPAAALLALVLFAYGAVNSSDESQNLLESALGLPAITLDEAFTFDATYYTVDTEDQNVGGED